MVESAGELSLALRSIAEGGDKGCRIPSPSSPTNSVTRRSRPEASVCSSATASKPSSPAAEASTHVPFPHYLPHVAPRAVSGASAVSPAIAATLAAVELAVHWHQSALATDLDFTQTTGGQQDEGNFLRIGIGKSAVDQAAGSGQGCDCRRPDCRRCRAPQQEYRLSLCPVSRHRPIFLLRRERARDPQSRSRSDSRLQGHQEADRSHHSRQRHPGR